MAVSAGGFGLGMLRLKVLGIVRLVEAELIKYSLTDVFKAQKNWGSLCLVAHFLS